MRHHLTAASLSLLIAACAHDDDTTVALPARPVAAAQARPQETAGAWSDQAMPLISHAGRRWVVIASGLEDDAAEGPVRVVTRDDLVVTERAPRATAVPARWRAPGRVVRANTHAGTSCALRLGAPTVLSRVSLDPGILDTWNGRDGAGNPIARRSDADIAAEAYEQGSGGRLLVAEVLDRACADASWAQVSAHPAVRFEPAPADDATRRAAIAAYRATEPWRAVQANFREYGDEGHPPAHDALWDELREAPTVTTWRATEGGRTFVTVRGGVPFEGCGAFAGAVWSVFEREGDRLVPLAASEGDFVPTEVVDADGDGAPEFLSADEVRALGPSGYEPVLSVAYPVQGCPC